MKQIGIRVLLIAALIGVFAATIFVWKAVEDKYAVVSPETGFSQSPTPTPDPMADIGILLLGYGGGKHEGGLLSDTMILAYIMPKEKHIVLVSIPRDSWVELPLTKNSTVGYKINAAYAVGTDQKLYSDRPNIYKGEDGGVNLAAYAVSRFTGLPVNHVAAVSFEGFKNAVSNLGGIEVSVPFSFTDEFYPIEGKETETCGKNEEEMKAVIATTSGYVREQQFKCRYETLKFEKGIQTMDADTALKFVRSRHSDVNGGDFGRSLRQQAFLKGVRSKLLSLSGLGKLIPFVSSMMKSVDTDITATSIAGMVSTYGDMSKFELTSLPLSDDNVLVASQSADGQYILVQKPDLGEFGIRNFVQNEIRKIASASATTH